jgi:hypothetical protein
VNSCVLVCLALLLAVGSDQVQISLPSVNVAVRRRYDRGHRNWNKHMRELLNHSAAWDYDAAWAPALHAHKIATRATLLPGQRRPPSHSPEPTVTPDMCTSEKTRAHLERITPPEMTLARLRRHSSNTR